MMRRAATALALLSLAALALPAGASATPTVSLTVTPVSIKGFPDTGDLLGGGAAIQARLSISGSEAPGGVPSQLVDLDLALPRATKISDARFATCSTKRLKKDGPSGCPRASQAGPVGTNHAFDVIGAEPVRETGTTQAFFGPGNQLSLYTSDPSPISGPMVATGRFPKAGLLGGPELRLPFPAIPTLPGAPNASMQAIDVSIGGAVHRGSKTYYYATLPPTCPKGGWPYQSTLTFQNKSVVTTKDILPCPTRSAVKRPEKKATRKK